MSNQPPLPKKRGRPVKHQPLRDENGELIFTIEYAPEWPEHKRHQFSQVARMLYLRWFSDSAPDSTATNPTKDIP